MLEARLAGTKPQAERGVTIAVRELLQRREPSLPKKEKMAVRHLNFYYQNGNQALKDISMPIYAQSVTALFGRAVGMRQVNLDPGLQSHLCPLPRAAHRRWGAARRREHPCGTSGSGAAQSPDRNGVSDTDTIPHVDITPSSS
jgi:hypothetical protein